MSRFSLKKTERLCSASTIESLFSKTGKSLLSHPFRFTFLYEPGTTHPPIQVLFLTSRKKQKRAVDRNRRKRLLRELYRLNKEPLISFLTSRKMKLSLAISFIGNEELNFHSHLPLFVKALQKLISELEKTSSISVPDTD